MKKLTLIFTTILLFVAAIILPAQHSVKEKNPWHDVKTNTRAAKPADLETFPAAYRSLSLDESLLKNMLQTAPLRHAGAAKSEMPVLSLPLPDGGWQKFYVVEAPVMHPDLAKKYPGNFSYAGYGVEDPTAYARFDLTQNGFHGMITSAHFSTVFINPLETGKSTYYSFYKKDLSSEKSATHSCGAAAEKDDLEKEIFETQLRPGDCQFRSYRLALACTAEYAQFHGGTVASVLAAMVTAMTRVNGVYERELSITLTMIPDNDQLIFFNANTDPYTNQNGAAMLSQNQTTVDNIIGSANYDMGHVFSTGGGGIAEIRSVCDNSRKAEGVTGLPSPVGDPFYIDFVAHEMGHQCGANHTQNNNCGRVSSAAMEPGSASTLMGYAGICAPNVQGQSDDYFHAHSLFEIANYMILGNGNSCATITSTGNQAPTADAGLDLTLPVSTPFVLRGTSADDGGTAALTHTWEQMNPQTATMPPQSTSTSGPAFRSAKPVSSPARYFPNLNDLRNNVSPVWEVLPSVSRTMRFRFTVRDNFAAGGCTDEDDVDIVFSSSAGPFLVTYPNDTLTWIIGETRTITWDVANTNQAPVSCATVDILLSTDGGLTYPVVLAQNIPNNGTANIIVPNQPGNQTRVMVKCSGGNAFFDISDKNFRIREPLFPTFVFNVNPENISTCNTTNATFNITLSALSGFSESTILSVSGLPAGATTGFSQNPVIPSGATVLTISNLTAVSPGTYNLVVTGTAASVTVMKNLTLTVFNANPAPISLTTPVNGALDVAFDVNLVWQASANAQSYEVEIATSPAFGVSTVASGSVTSTTFPVSGLNSNTIYYWRVRALNPCATSAYSSVFAFKTLNTGCQSYTSTNVPVTIPDVTSGSYTSTVNIPDAYNIFDLNVFVEINHTWMGDLDATLTSPGNETVQLFDRPGFPSSQFGCGEDNLRVLFDQASANTSAALESTCNTGQQYAINGSFRPVGNLNNYNGDNISGTWTLTVRDNAQEDGGSLIAWRIDACRTIVPPTAPVLINNLTLQVLQSTTEIITNNFLQASAAGNDPDQITFLLRSIPAHGQLLLDNVVLSVGATFSQQEINDGLLKYRHTASNGITADNFIFEVFNQAGGWLANNTFNIEIELNNLAVTGSVTASLNCFGDDNAQITASTTGGTPPYQYSLNGSSYQSSPVFTNLATGDYIITVRDANNFEKTSATLTITNPDQIVVTAEVADDDITVNASGGTGTLTYSIDGNTFQASNIFNDLANGAYTITVRDENGCEATTSAIIAVNTLIVSATVVRGVSCHDASDAEISANVAGGVPPYEYSLNGGAFQSSNVFSNLPAGIYEITVQDQGGFVQTTSMIIIANPAAIQVSVDVNNNQATATASGGTGTLRYSIDGNTFQASNIFNNLANGTYTLTVRDANNCIASVPFTIALNTLVVSTLITEEISCAGANDGVISVVVSGGTPPFQYSINNGPFQNNNVFENLGPGDYIITVSDGEGFTRNSGTLTLTEPLPLSGVFSLDGYEVTITPAGGTPPYEFSRDGINYQTGNIFPNTYSGTYTFYIKDDNGCISPVSVSVNVPTLLGSVVVTGQILCNGDLTGQLTVQALGGIPSYEYSLNNGPFVSGNVFSDLAAGDYTIGIRDAGGLIITVMETITEPDEISISYDIANQAIVVFASGGTGDFEYQIDGSGFQSDNIFGNVEAGETYAIEVKDENGCIKAVTVTIPQVQITAINATDISCNGETDGRIEVLAQGGVLPLSYSLDGQNYGASNIFENLPAGNYTIFVRDAAGFVTPLPLQEISEPAVLEGDADATGGTITVDATGGTPPFSYSLNGVDFQSSNVFENVPMGTYTITIRDSRGCEITLMVSSVRGLTENLVFEIFPNPSKGLFNLEITGETGSDLQIEVFDMLGKLLFVSNVEKFGVRYNAPLNLQMLAPGSYQLLINDGKSIGRKTFMITK